MVLTTGSSFIDNSNSSYVSQNPMLVINISKTSSSATLTYKFLPDPLNYSDENVLITDTLFTSTAGSLSNTYDHKTSLSKYALFKNFLMKDYVKDSDTIKKSDASTNTQLGDFKFEINATGFDATKTQVLKNVNGTLTWVDEA